MLDETLSSAGATAYQAYWTVEDTAAWEAVAMRADTIYKEGNYRKIRSGGIWYEYTFDDGIIKAEQHYPGFKRAFDSVAVPGSVVYSRRYDRLLADVRAADVVLGPDSVRIAVVQITGRAFPWQRFRFDTIDYLALFPPGTDSIPLTLGQDNLGPITGQTVFRLGRRHYALRSVSPDRRELVVEPIRDPGDIAVTAEVDLNFRRVAVNDLDGNPATLSRQDGRKLVLFFTSAYPYASRTLERLDSFYRAMPPSRRDRFQVEVILQHATPETARAFLDTTRIDLPVYLANSKTCLRLNCRPTYPYYVGTTGRGRITTFWGRADDLADRFGGDSLLVY